MTPFQEHLAHLLKLALHPGFKDHAWHRAKEMEAESPLWEGMPQALTQAVRAHREASTSS